MVEGKHKEDGEGEMIVGRSVDGGPGIEDVRKDGLEAMKRQVGRRQTE